MRIFIITFFAILLIVGCSNPDNLMQLSGTVKGLKKGTILLQKFDDTLLMSVDSIEIDGDPNFVFSREIKSPEIYYLYLRLKDGTLRDDRISFFAEPNELTISTTLKDFGNSPLIIGSQNHNKLLEYERLLQRFNDQNLDLIEAKFRAHQEKNDSLVAVYDERQQSIVRNKYLATVNFAINNSDMELAPYLMLSEVYDANIKYLDTVYKVLTPRIKESKYGIELNSYINNRRELEK